MNSLKKKKMKYKMMNYLNYNIVKFDKLIGTNAKK